MAKIFIDDDGGQHIFGDDATVADAEAAMAPKPVQPSRDTLPGGAVTAYAASAGTGIARELAALGSIGPDLANLLPGVNLPGSAEATDWVNKHFYQPQTPGERRTAAGVGGVIGGAPLGPGGMVTGGLGGLLGDQLANSPGLAKIAPPEVLQVAGNLIPAIGAQMLPSIISKVPFVGPVIKGLGEAVKDAIAPKMVASGRMPTAEELAAMRAQGTYPQWYLNKLAQGVQDSTWGHAFSVPPDSWPQSIAKALYRMVVQPEAQGQANQPQ